MNSNITYKLKENRVIILMILILSMLFAFVAPISTYAAGNFTITYDANGGEFSSGNSQNQVPYTQETITKTSKTPNLRDDGVQEGYNGYPSSWTNRDVVTIEGASSLKVTIKYSLMRDDWVAVYDNSLQAAYGNYAKSVSGKLQSTGTKTATYIIEGDTAQFFVASNSSTSNGYYGYYAIVEAVFAEDTTDAYNEPTVAPTEGSKFVGWYTDADCTEGNEFDVNSATGNMTVYAKYDTPITITYDANGGAFKSGEGQNQVHYSPDTYVVSQTPYVYNNGESSNGYEAVPNGINDVVTIEGAEALEVTIKYGTYSSNDWVAVYDGSVTPNVDNYAESISGKLRNSSTRTSTFIVEGDTAQFFFRSSSSSAYFGYYAIVKPITRTLRAGTYEEPIYLVDEHNKFFGWYTDPECTDGNEFNPTPKNIGSLAENVTLYAKYEEPRILTYDANGGTFKSGNSQNKIYFPPERGAKISKTSNIDDDGVKINSNPSAPHGIIDTVTIKDAEALKVTITYQLHPSYDWVAIYDGSTNPTTSNYDSSISGKLESRTKITETFTVEGDTVQFLYYSSYAANVYGYYAIVEPVSLSVWEGEYEEPLHSMEGLDFQGWYTDPDCTEGNEFESSQFSESMTVYAKYTKHFAVTYDANGGAFGSSGDGNTQNKVYYKDELVTGPKTSKISKTSNVHDDGVNYTGGYAANLNTTDIVTIPGAEFLTVTIKYATEPSSDWVALYDGSVTPDQNNYDESISGKLSGGYSTPTTATFTVEGDTAQFFFHTNSYSSYWGYYAVVEGAGKIHQWAQFNGAYENPTPSVEESQFAGWYTDVECTDGNEFDLKNFDGASDVTVYAKYLISDILLKFDANGGAFYNGSTQNALGYNQEGNGLTKIFGEYEEPTLSTEGSMFIGWYTDPECTDGNEFDFENAELTSSITVYAKYFKPFSITYDANGGAFTSDESQNVLTYGQKDGALSIIAGTYEEPKHEGVFPLIGWYTDKACTEGNEFDSDIKGQDIALLDSDITVYAKYSQPYTITFDSNGGDAFSNGNSQNEVSYFQGKSIISKTDNVDRNGNQLSGPYNATDDTITIDGASALLVTIKSQINSSYDSLRVYDGSGNYIYSNLGSVDRTFIVNGDTVRIQLYLSSYTGAWREYYGYYATVKPLPTTYSGSYEEPENSSVEYSEFVGWYTNAECSNGNEADINAIAEDTTVYAKYTIPYTVTYNSNGGLFADGQNVKDVVYNNVTGSILNGAYETPTRDGYGSFAGWYTTPECEDGSLVDVSTIRENTTVYAKFYDLNTITYNSNGGTFEDGNKNIVVYEDETNNLVSGTYKSPTPPEGSKFAGWYTDSACTDGNEFSPDSVTDSREVYAKYNGPYTITYDANGGEFASGNSQNLVLYPPKASPKISKTFNVKNDGNLDSSYYNNNSRDLDVVKLEGASLLKVTITYQTESTNYDWVAIYDGSATPTEYNYDSSISGKLGGTAKTTQTFIVEGDTVQFYFRTDGSGNSYYGYYAIVEEALDSETLSGTYEEPAHPLNAAFVGWYTDAGCTKGNEVNINTIDKDTTVYAKYELPVTITYDANGGTFASGDTQNNVQYAYTDNGFKISKTSNVNDDGTTNSSYNPYASSGLNDIVTIKGAEALKVTITYQLSSSYWISVYDGTITPTTSNYGSSISGKLTGTTKTTKTFIIEGDTAQFFYYSSSSGNYYGYYATVEVADRTVCSGDYEEPISSTEFAEFAGWYTDPECTDGNEFKIGTAYKDVTVYAKYNFPVNVTYDANGGTFASGDTQNNVQYAYIDNGFKISKTSNVNDDGTTNSSNTPTSSGLNDIVTIKGAEALKVTITYELANSPWVAIYDGSVTPTTSNYGSSISGKLNATSSKTTKTFIIEGDTVQFFYYSSGSYSGYYGYYATVEVADRIVHSGDYEEPTHSLNAAFGGWYTDPECTDGNEFDIGTAYKDVTVYAKYNFPVNVTYDANGGTFASGDTQNKVTYAYVDNGFKISKTSNVNDDGTINSSNMPYASTSSGDNDIVTIKGAEALKVTITYQIPSSPWVAIYDGSVTPTTSNYGSSISGKLTAKAKTTKTFIIEGDTVQFFYYNNSGLYSGYYGYYATVEVADRIVYSGDYEEPTSSTEFAEFAGWYTDPECTDGNEFDVGTAYKDVTVYAKYVYPYTITYDANNGGAFKPNGATQNKVTYMPKSPPVISKTPNLATDGTELPSGYALPDTGPSGVYETITLEGARALKVTINYEFYDGNFDWVAIYDGSVTPTQYNYDSSISGKLSGYNYDRAPKTETFIVEGDTVQIFYKRESYYGPNYYGYYAVVEEISTETSDAYKDPSPLVDGAAFIEWYTDPECTKGNEVDFEKIYEDTTVYAKYVGPYTVTYHLTEGTFDDGTTENTVVYSGESLTNEALEPVILSGTYKEPDYGEDKAVMWYTSSELAENTRFNVPKDFEMISNDSHIDLYSKKDVKILEESGPIYKNDSWAWTLYADGTLKIYPTNGISGQMKDISECEWVSGTNEGLKEFRLKVKKVVVEGTVFAPPSTSMMFGYFDNCTEMDLSGFDTSKVTQMTNMFYSCDSLLTVDVSSFDTSHVTAMSAMFDDCSSLQELDLSNFDTSSTTKMGSMFDDCESLQELDLSNFDTTNVTTMDYMFRNCESLQKLDVSNFNTSNITNMSSMFRNCSSLQELDLSNFDTSNVTDMFNMFIGCSSLRELDLSSFDTSNVEDMGQMFYGCSSLRELDLSNFDTSNVTDMHDMFNFCLLLQKLDLSNFNTSKVNNMSTMFRYCESLQELDISNFDTSNVTNMFEMFHNCPSLQELDVSSFDTSNVCNMASMFNGCTILEELDLSNFNTSRVEDMNSMFAGCKLLSELNISSFDTSNVYDMTSMFSGCKLLEKLDLSNFNTSMVETMTNMFANCYILKELDVTSFDTSNVYDMCGMFQNCYILKELDLSSFYTWNADITDMFNGANIEKFIFGEEFASLECTEIVSANWIKTQNSDGSNTNDTTEYTSEELMMLYYDSEPILAGTWERVIEPIVSGESGGCLWELNAEGILRVWPKNGVYGELGQMPFDSSELHDKTFEVVVDDGVAIVGGAASLFEDFYNCVKMDLSGLDTSKVTDMSYMFCGCSSLLALDLSNFDTSNVEDMQKMFLNCEALLQIDASNWNTNKVQDMDSMFSDCIHLIDLDLGDFDTSSVTDMSSMFKGCNTLKTLNLSSFDVSNVQNMYRMFYNCNSLTTLDLSNFDTRNVKNMNSMFGECASLKTLNISNFDTENVTNMSQMFYRCDDLYELDLSNFNTANVKNMNQMFSGCDSLRTLDLSSFDTSSVTDMSQMFYECRLLNDLDLSNFNTSALINMSQMFRYCVSLVDLDLSSFNTSNVTNMSQMFYGCSALSELDLSNFDTLKTQYMSEMFRDCSSLKELNLSSFNTSNITNMSYMFYNCKSLKELDLSSFDTSKVSSMYNMFQYCSSLKNLDLSSFNTSNVNNMNNMFDGASSLETLNIATFDTAKVSSMNSMFKDLNSLNRIMFGNNFVFEGTNGFKDIEGEWIHFRNSDGGKTYDDAGYTSEQLSSLTAYTTPQIGGIWVKGVGSVAGDDYITNPDGSVEYISQDEYWTIVSDEVWTYSFSVFDDTLTYYLFEEFMEDYISEAMAPYYITIIDNKATLTNTTTKESVIETGELVVQKIVEGSDTQEAFMFTVTLKGNEILGTQIFGGVAFKDGVGSFSLKDGESKIFDIPVDVEYAVEEKVYEEYTTTYSSSQTGTISANETQTIVVTNTYVEIIPEPERTTNITIIKKLEGEAKTSDKFNVSAYITGLKPSTVYTLSNDTTFTTTKEGIGFCNIPIGEDEEVVIHDIPVGATYQFTEAAGEYTSSYNIAVDGVVIETGANNAINTAMSTASNTVGDVESIIVEFVNKLHTVQNLTITKVVKEELEDGSLVDLDVDSSYEFTVVFSNMDKGVSFNSTIGKVVADEDGEAYKTFYLKNGESAEFSNIPVGVKYTVEESASVYQPSYTVTGTKVAKDSATAEKNQKLSTSRETVDVNENSIVTFTNLKLFTKDKAVRLIKSIDTQGNPDIIEMLKNNRMYHLDGAEYELVIDGEVVETLVTDVDGEAISTQVFADGTTGVLREVKAPDGFLLNETEYTFTIDTSSADVYCDVNVSDVPTFDPAIIRIKKTDSGTGTAQGNATFEGAVFKYEYFDNLDWTGVPTRTWYFVTDENGVHAYHPDYLAEGYVSAELYEPSEGSYLIPLGSVKITEVVAPAGYKVMPVMYATITQASSGADAKWTYTQETLAFLKAGLDDLYEGEEPIDEAKLGGLTIQKLDAATNTATPAEGATFEGCEFTIYNKSANAVKIGDNEVAQPNEACMVIVVGADGKAVTGNVLPIGTYEVKETKGNSFYSCNTEWSYTFTVDGTTDNAQFNTECANVETPEVTILKVDNEYNALAGAKLQIKDADGNVIAEWTSTTEDFKIRLAEGTYVLHEQLPPYGYTWAEDIEFTVTNDDANTVIMVDVPLTVMVSTGGEGIIKIVVLSIVLGGIAGILVFLGKKKSKNDDESDDESNDNVDDEADTE